METKVPSVGLFLISRPVRPSVLPQLWRDGVGFSGTVFQDADIGVAVLHAVLSPIVWGRTEAQSPHFLEPGNAGHGNA